MKSAMKKGVKVAPKMKKGMKPNPFAKKGTVKKAGY